jgi:hypothetical protein
MTSVGVDGRSSSQLELIITYVTSVCRCRSMIIALARTRKLVSLVDGFDSQPKSICLPSSSFEAQIKLSD